MIRSLDIRPGAKPDALLMPQPRRTVAGWIRERERRIEARRRAGRRLAYHIITATAPASRKPAPQRRRVRPWVVISGFLMAAPTLALVAGATWQILRRML